MPTVRFTYSIGDQHFSTVTDEEDWHDLSEADQMSILAEEATNDLFRKVKITSFQVEDDED